jgi:hypothetical protein
MSARKKRRTTDAQKTTIFDGCVFALGKGISSDLKVQISANGGEIASTVTNRVTHYVTNQKEIDADGKRVTTAEAKNAFLVPEKFVFESIENGALEDEDDYAFDVKEAKPKKTSTKRKRNGSAKTANQSRFLVLRVNKPMHIRDFINENGLDFEKGRGFYEFDKKEKIQDYKEILLMDTKGNFYEGDYARELLGLPKDDAATIDPVDSNEYTIFVQSTSWNRNLEKGTRFLYDKGTSAA